ncbi:hypothetical protein AB0M39_01940 [Streptomyces sp. NPDC051907]|uniref:hypothetical protein n=1 Tax=Streptomyces sp. NPDC051907 TaxID=3155284 RepID=UPI00343509BB
MKGRDTDSRASSRGCVEALEARSDLTDLQDPHPELAARLAQLRERLDQPSGNPPAGDLSEAVERRRRLNDELSETLTRIRESAGFATRPGSSDRQARRPGKG